MFKLWATLKKDFRVLIRDWVGISLMFIMPIILVVVVTGLQNSTFQLMDKNKLLILVCNNDTGQSAKELISSLDKIGIFKVSQTKKGLSARQLTDSMQNGDAMLGIIIPRYFSAKVMVKAKSVAGDALKSFGLQGDSAENKPAGDVGPLTVYYSPILQESVRMSVKGAVQSSLQMVQSGQVLKSLYFSVNEKPLPGTLQNEMLNSRATINEVPVSKDGARKAPNATQHNVPAWTIFAMFFVIMSLGGSVVREKINGSFIRLKTLPTNYMVGLLSKQITYMCVTMLQALVIFSMGAWLFPFIGLPPLNLPADFAALFITTLFCGWCAVSYAICVGVFADTQEQANGFGAVSIVILSCIGGLMIPSFAMQGPAKTAANFSPMHWCLEAYYSLFLEGAKLRDVFPNLVRLFGITLVIQLATWYGLRKKNLI
jgi:ABC-2 type transport system permease protein